MIKSKVFYLLSLIASLTFGANTVSAASIDFQFTGQLTIESGDQVIAVYPISANLNYNTVAGVGSSDLTISTGNQFFFGFPMLFHSIEMQRVGSSNFIAGTVYVDWNINTNLPAHLVWDATGLFNAIDYGLQQGDVLSGSSLYHDGNGNGSQDPGEFLADIASAIPHADTIVQPIDIQGPAPMAATDSSPGLGNDTPFPGIRALFDIGSGNSMFVTSVSAVPVPAAAWLFCSGLIALVGVSRKSVRQAV